MPGQFNFVVPQGDTLQYAVVWQPGGVTANLTDFTAEMLVWDAEQVTIETYTTETEGGLSIDGPAGTITIAAQTEGIAPGCYSYFLRITSPGGIITTVLDGAFQVTPEGPQGVTG